MKQKKLNLAVVMLLTIGLNIANAQSLFVKETAGAETEYTLAGVSKLTFSSGNLVVNGTPSGTYALTGLQKLTFNSTEGPTPTCLNSDGDFSTGIGSWVIYPGATTYETSSGALVVTSATSGAWDVQASTFYAFEAGTEYTISFVASCPTPIGISIMIRDTYTPVTGLEWSQAITATPNTYSVTFTAPAGTPGDELLLAIGGNNITIDDVCISEGPTLNVPEQEFNKDQFRIYPNPVSSEFNIIAPKAGSVDVISLEGKVLMSTQVQEGNSTINIDGLSTGIYICRYANNKEVKTLKLVKK